jgi:hypothetical protein
MVGARGLEPLALTVSNSLRVFLISFLILEAASVAPFLDHFNVSVAVFIG